MSPQAAEVCVVDDEVSVRRALRRLLVGAGYAVEVFGSADEFLARPRSKDSVCLVLDLAMPGMDGLALQARLAAAGMDPAIVFLTGHGDIPSSVRAMKGGAVDFLTKPVDETELLAAVSEALRCQRDRLRQGAEAAEASQRLAQLTPREREVASLVVRGLRNKQIAFELGIVEKTVKVHRGRIMEKTGVRSVAGLVRLWDLVRAPDSA